MLISKISRIFLPIWTAIILYLTLVPGKFLVKTPLFSYDKFGHMLIFIVWTALYWFVLDSSKKFTQREIYLRSSVVSIAFGGIIEILQLLLPIYRSAELYDFVADVAGTIVALAVIVPVSKYIGKKISWY